MSLSSPELNKPISARHLEASAYLKPYELDPVSLKVGVLKGNAYISGKLVEFAGGESADFTAPTTNPRIDLLVLDSDGNLERVEGAEGASPDVPAIPFEKVLLAQVYNRVGQTSIKDTDDSSNGYVQKDLRGFIGVGGVRHWELTEIEKRAEDDSVFWSNDAQSSIINSGVYTKVKEIQINEDLPNGVNIFLNLIHTSTGAGDVSVRLNGVEFYEDTGWSGTSTRSIDHNDPMSSGDTIGVFVRRASGGALVSVSNFRLRGTRRLTRLLGLPVTTTIHTLPVFDATNTLV